MLWPFAASLRGDDWSGLGVGPGGGAPLASAAMSKTTWSTLILGAAAYVFPSTAHAQDLLRGELDDTRAHIGALLGGGPSHTDNSNGDAVGSLLFALKGGLFFDRFELGLEFAPATYVMSFRPDIPSVHMNLYGGYHIPVYKSISWPLRVGLGFTTPTFRGDAGDTLLALRADLIGVSVLLADKFLLDVHVPSWRVNIDAERGGAFFSYIFGVGFAYAPKI